jgi:demethylmenaquinone methyltransferase/2-methoxy-6-polyprenyl-1,4-benzoquinol methylase
MFDRIAPRYDLLNGVMSGGLDRRWRRRAAAACDLSAGMSALDCCTGTGDLALEMAARVTRHGLVTGLDFSPEMLTRARAKAESRGVPIRFVRGDALALPFADDAFDAAAVAFGARNWSDLEAGLAELVRVVRPGGRVVVLEITTPTRLRRLNALWFERVVPVVGRLVSGDRSAYSYLPASARRFPTPPHLAAILRAAGLRDVGWSGHMGGIIALHHGRVR